MHVRVCVCVCLRCHFRPCAHSPVSSTDKQRLFLHVHAGLACVYVRSYLLSMVLLIPYSFSFSILVNERTPMQNTISGCEQAAKMQQGAISLVYLALHCTLLLLRSLPTARDRVHIGGPFIGNTVIHWHDARLWSSHM